MKYILSVLIALLSMPFAGKAQAGSAPKPVQWEFSVKKMENDVYRFEAKATMDKGFHIWALDAGGDGSLIPTSFIVEGLQSGNWAGDWKESASPKVQTVDGMDGAIRSFEKTVTFYRDFKGRRGDKVKGAVQYQSCNEMVCFPPAVENFVVLVN